MAAFIPPPYPGLLGIGTYPAPAADAGAPRRVTAVGPDGAEAAAKSMPAPQPASPPADFPLQALVLLNDPTYVEAARVFAARIIREGGNTDATRIDFAVRQALGRKPSADEVQVLAKLCRKHRADYALDPDAAAQLIHVGEWPLPDDDPAETPVELAAWTSVARVILNLHESITRY